MGGDSLTDRAPTAAAEHLIRTGFVLPAARTVTCEVALADAATPVGTAAVLDAAEHRRATAYRFARDRARFVVGRWLVKTLVATVYAVAPADIHVGQCCVHCGSREHGKPFARHPGGEAAISISHSGDLVVAATSDGSPVGVDVQQVDGQTPVAVLRRHVRAAGEAGADDDLEELIRAWTLKEAILKCTGDGLVVPMTDLTIDLGGARPQLVAWAGRRTPCLFLAELAVPGSHRCAIALATNAPAALRVRAVGSQ